MTTMTGTTESPRTGPMAGVRIIDITAVLMGPSATQMLARPGRRCDQGRAAFGRLHAQDRRRWVKQKMGPIYLGLNRNKRSLVLDLKQPEAREVAAETRRQPPTY